MNSSGYSRDNQHTGSVLITENLTVRGDVKADDLVFDEAKLGGNLDCDNNDILNCNNLQAVTFNGGVPLTNPLSSNLDCANNFVENCPQVQNAGGGLTFVASGTILTFAPSVNLNAKVIIDATTTRLSGNEIKCDNQNVTGVNEIHTDNLTSNQNANIESLVDIDMSNNSLTSVSSIDTLNIGHTTNPAVPMNLTTNMICSLNSITGVGTLGCSSVDTSTISNTVGDLFVNSNTDFQTNNISNIGNTNTDTVTTTQINGNPGLNINLPTAQLTTTSQENRIFQERIIYGTTLPQQTTIHIFEASGFGGTVNVAGFDFHPLDINTAYIIHGDITLTAGLLFQINCSVRGATIASKIIFDESTKDIQAFRATDNNVYLDSLTISGGGGHFTSTDVGLFNCQNYSIGAGAPFYGRNKRFRVVNCNILSAYSLGIVYGYGTVNINNNFINGGGGSPSGVYTRVGLTVSSGLSLECNSNKVVLFAGAQTASSTYMLRFISIDPLLQINAVNISGNIFHPRDVERGVLFEEDSKTALGLIASNTFIRTGGTAPLIDYPRATIFDNYNVKELENFEILANAGVIDATGVLQCSTTTLNTLNSATFVDLDMPITAINPISKAKRFAYKFIVTGVSGGPYTKGNFLVSVTNPAIYGYIIEQQTILAGTEILYITDMNGIFPDLLNYKEQDSTLTDTGVTSTGLQIGNNSDNIELYYFDKDPIDVQFGIQISYENSSADDEIQFRLELDTGSGYSPITDSLISTASVRANRGVSATMNVIQRLQRGDLIKLVYRYIDSTTTTITKITYTGK